MSNPADLLIPPVIVAVVWLLVLRWPETGRRVARTLAAISGVILLLIMTTGLMWSRELFAEIHKWSSHGLVIFVWSAVPFTIFVVLNDARQRPVVAIVRVLALMLLVIVLLIASSTGYVGPSHGPISPQTLQRFRVLHFFVFPGFVVVLNLYWFLLLRTVPKPMLESCQEPPSIA